jgi:hypothetical protein
MTLRPAFVGAAIIALLLTRCAGTAESAPGATATSTPTPSGTPDATGLATPGSTGEPAIDPVPAVDSIVLHPHAIDFLTADGTAVDSVSMDAPADDAKEAITLVLKTSPSVGLTDREVCGNSSRISTWPGGLSIVERPGEGTWWTGMSEYQVILEGQGHGGIRFEAAGGYGVGDPFTSDAGVSGTLGSTENDSPKVTFQWFAAEVANPDAPELERWGVSVTGVNWVVDRITSPKNVFAESC